MILPISAQRNLADLIGITSDSVYEGMRDSTIVESTTLHMPRKANAANTIVPSSYSIDTTKEVGSIPYQSSVLPSGAVVIEVPIEMAEDTRGYTPSLSLSYNSMGGAGPIGNGWSLSGLSVISRVNKTFYYDGKTEGISSTQDKPAYSIDGQRLILTKSTDSIDTYQSEQGFIKAMRVKNVSNPYFKVLRPDGTHGEYQCTDGLNYYITKSTNAIGNSIFYGYDSQEGHWRIRNIVYGTLHTARVDFTYTPVTSSLTPVSYSGGVKTSYPYLLSSIRTTFNVAEIRKYDMTYQQKGLVYELTSVNSSAGGSEMNPLKFYYGKDNKEKEYDVETVYTMPSFSFGTSEKNVYGQRIKFDYHDDNEGVMLFENKIPYYEEMRATYHRIINYYGSNSTILINNALDQSTAIANSITTESGFRDAFPMNVDGMEEEELVKFNNIISETTDSVVFTVYAMAWTYAPAIKYRRSYAWNNVITAGGTKSVSPKECYQGDFNGDGKPELMVISASKPLDIYSIQTRCMIVDLENDTILYNGSPFEYNLKVPGTFNGTQRTPQQAYNLSDKIRITDYDGDGKSEICLISSAGSDLYAFDSDSNGHLVCQQKYFSSNLHAETVKDRTILQGDFNGDGKTDILITPKDSNSDWHLFSAKGNGAFDSKTLNICTYNADMACIVQDMNLDGQSDVVVKNGATLTTYFIANQAVQGNLSTTIPEHSVIVPTNIHRDYSTYNLVAIDNEWYARKIRIDNDDCTNRLLTGMVNSLGVIDRYSYSFLDAADTPYAKGSNASFPYENFIGGLAVCTKSETYHAGTLYSRQNFSYTNAVVHKQGLGFLGFEKVYTSNNVTLDYSDMTFDPFRRSVMTRLEDNKHISIYEYNLIYVANKTLKTQMTKETRTDKATGNVTTTTNSYNIYNNISKTETAYNDGTKKWQTISYIPSTKDSNYFLDRIYAVIDAETRPSGYINHWTKFFYNTNNTIYLKKTSFGSPQISSEEYTYDASNQLIKKSTKKYSDTQPLEEEYTYNNLGQLASRKDPLGLVTSYVYDQRGRLSTTTFPDGTTATRTYDAWGRLVSEKKSDGTAYTSSLQWVTDDSNAIYQQGTTQTNAFERYARYDAFGREVQSGEWSATGLAPTTYTEYDYRGRVARVSEPQFFHGSTEWTEYEYDSYDRPVTITYPSGKTETFSYSGLSATITADGVATTKTYKANGDLISVTDPAGTTTYTYHKSGQPATITAPGNATTTITYDNYFRRTSITDPNAGTTTFTYDTRGNLASQADANGNVTTFDYDQYDRLSTKQHSNATGSETLTTTYLYDNVGRLQETSSSNGSGASYSYDNKGRLSGITHSMNDKFIAELRNYDSDGHLTSRDYKSQDGYITTENYIYNHEKVAKIYLPEESENVWNNLLLSTGDETASIATIQADLVNGNGLNAFPILQTESIAYSVRSTDLWGNTSVLDSGPFNHNVAYDSDGNCTSISLKKGKAFPTITPQAVNGPITSSKTFFAESYAYDAATGNLTTRTDGINDTAETFAYDGLNRLVSSDSGNVDYDAVGNIAFKDNVGTYSYSGTQPFAVTGIAPAGNCAVPLHNQSITYNSMQRVAHLSENGHVADFWYGDSGNRVKMARSNGTQTFTKYYLGDRYELIIGPNGYKRQIFYVGGNAYTARVVKVKESDSAPWKKYYLSRDRLGSITMVIDSLGNAVQDVSYDAWGNLRDPQTHALYTEDDMPALFLERGYTGHEHLPEFGLINMNARLYDPVLGRFLSPDPYVQMPDNSQNFNRYSYCLNNPMRYVDQDGKVWWIPIVIGAAIGAYAGASIQSGTAAFWNWKSNAWQGAIAGGIVGAAVGYAFAGAIHASGMTMVTNGTVISSKASGIVGSVVNNGAINVGMNAIFKGGWDGAWKAGVAGLTTGAWTSTGGFGMVNAWGVKNTFAQLGGKLGYQMIGTSLGSIGSNWAAGRGIFSRVTLGLGPINLTIGKGEHLFQWKNNIGNLGMNAFGLINTIMGGKVSFDWKNLSINYFGGIIDKMFNPSEFASGFSPHVVTGNSNLINVYMHELHHLWHSRALNDLYLLNYGLQGLNSLLNANSFFSNGNYYEDFADYYNWW